MKQHRKLKNEQHEPRKLLDISKTRTTAYHPSSNGIIERFKDH